MGTPSEAEKFDATMKKILSMSKAELQRRIEEEKKAKSKTAGYQTSTNRPAQ
jgi:hypothetical protein